MSLGTAAILLSGVGVLVTGYLAVIFTYDPVIGMAQVNHLPEYLPQVMADRYIGMLVLAVAATLYRDLWVITVLFAVFAFLGFADAWIYLRAGTSYIPHLAAGIAGAGVSVVALVAKLTGART